MGCAERTEPNLRETLDSAAELCKRALADYSSGVIDEAELRGVLFRTGLVQWPDQAWLLDVGTGRWWRYDGMVLRDGGEARGTFARLRHVVDDLSEETVDIALEGRR